jgi:hypothetical protein
MKKFFAKSLLLIIPVLVFLFAMQPFIDNGLKHTDCSASYKEWNDIFESKINADLLIQGNSRAVVHVNPKYLDSAFHLNSYNLGVSGHPFQIQYYRFLIYLKYNRKPRYIVQVADYWTLAMRPDLFEFEQFIPYLKNDLIREAVAPYKFFNYNDLNFPYFKYTHKPNLYFYGLASFLGFPFPPNGKYKGFDVNTNREVFKGLDKLQAGHVSKIDTVSLRLFEKFMTYCQHENIKIIFINPPVFTEGTKVIQNRNQVDSIYSAYALKYNIPYLDYTRDSMCNNIVNFQDYLHLNANGVTKFNKMLGSDLKKFIPN